MRASFNKRRRKLGVVVPCYSKRGAAAETHAPLGAVLDECECKQICVDDGSAHRAHALPRLLNPPSVQGRPHRAVEQRIAVISPPVRVEERGAL